MILALTLQTIILAAAQAVGGECVELWNLNGELAKDRMGRSVAIAGDVNADGFQDYIVGSSHDVVNYVDNLSKAQVYSGLDGSLIYEWTGARLKDLFGTAVAGVGDLNHDGFDDVVVGACYYHGWSWSSEPGKAYVYSGIDGSLMFVLTCNSASAAFGHSLTGAGDVNGDGTPDILVGASEHDNNYGEAFVFSGSDGTQLHKLKHTPNVNSQAYYGTAVAGGADFNGDGNADLVVGEPGNQCVYVYSGEDGSLLHTIDGPYLFHGEFGEALAVVSDADADGISDILIGNSRSWGTAYLYSGLTGLLIRDWTAAGIPGIYEMGCSVAEAGDVNADGTPDFIFGAKKSSYTGLKQGGSALVFDGKDCSLLYHWKGNHTWGHFGAAVAGGFDLNQDGALDFIVGAPGEHSNGLMDTGQVHVFSVRPFIELSQMDISVAIGGVVDVELDFPTDAGGLYYRLLLSWSGMGNTLVGVEIPLAFDSLFLNSFHGDYPISNSAGWHGNLDVYGDASFDINLPGPLPTSLIGRTVYLAAAAGPELSLPEVSSMARLIRFLP